MGKPKRRINPKVRTRVDRKLVRYATKKVRDVVYSLPKAWEGSDMGRPAHDARLVVVMLVLMRLFRGTYDSADDLADDPRIKRILGISRLPGHSVLHRGAKRLPQEYVQLLNEELTRKFRMKRLVVIVDSSGFRLRTSSAWYDIRIGRQNLRRDNEKLHIACDPLSGLILSYSITQWKAHDSPKFRSLLRNIRKILFALGDAGYLSRLNCRITVKKGGKPFFCLKKNTTAKADGCLAWKRMVEFFERDKELYEAIYHMRSFVEAVFSSLKRRFGACLHSVKKRMQKKELALKVIAYNIRRALFSELAEQLGEPLWVDA